MTYVPVIEENVRECESPGEMNRGANLGRLFFSFFIAESDRALYSRRVAFIASHLFQRRLRDHAYVDFYVAT